MTILYLGNKLSKHGFSVTSIETLGPRLEGLGYELCYASDKKNTLVRLLDMVWSICSNYKKIDRVIIDTYSQRAFFYAVICGWLCRRFDIPYFPILRGGGLPLALDRYRYLSDKFFNNSVVNVAPSGFLKHEFEQRGYRAAYIPNNIDIGIYRFVHRQKGVKPKLLWVRSFDVTYNPEMAVHVLAAIKRTFGNDARLCMVGPDKDGSLGVCKKLVAELNLEGDVVFTGKLSKKDWIDLAKDYDIFINTTDFDNTPVSVMEAMALGLPVVTTNVGGIPYLLSNGVDALFVNKGDVNGMVEQIEKLIENPRLAADISQNGRIKVESFDWEQVKQLWLNLLS